MREVEELFAHIADDRKQAAVDGVVRRNPHLNGIDFYTMMDMYLQADLHLDVVGDVLIGPGDARIIVEYLASL